MNIDTTDQKLVRLVAEGLVRIDDIYNDRKVYGGITVESRYQLKKVIDTAIKQGIEYQDIVESLTVYFTKLNEIGPIGPITGMAKPGQPPKPAGTSPQTPNAISQVAPAANVSIGSQQVSNPNTQQDNKPTTQQDLNDLAKGLEKTMKDPNFNKDFSSLLAKVLQKGM